MKNCYLNVLKLSEEHALTSLAVPNISTGIYRFPKHEAAQIAITMVQAHQAVFTKEVIFVCYDEENYQIYRALLGD